MLVVVGRLGRPHGVRGEISVEVRTDEPERRFFPGAKLITSAGSELTIDSVHWHSGRLLLSFAGYVDRTAVEQLRGLLVQVERSDDEQPEGDDEFYDSALVGCAVLDAAGVSVGVIKEVAHLPAQDLLVILTEDGRELLLPFIREFVPSVDSGKRVITVTPPPGLFDADE